MSITVTMRPRRLMDPSTSGGGQRDGGDLVRGQDVLDLEHGDAEHLVLDEEGDEILQILSLQGFQLLGAGCRDDLIHEMSPLGMLLLLNIRDSEAKTNNPGRVSDSGTPARLRPVPASVTKQPAGGSSE